MPLCEAQQSSGAWWPVPIVLVLWRQRQTDLESEVSQVTLSAVAALITG